jgi:hypothetical protein
MAHNILAERVRVHFTPVTLRKPHEALYGVKELIWE